MARWMKGIGLLALAGAMVFGLLAQRTGSGFCLSAAITFGTVAFHFLARLAVGLCYDRWMNNRGDWEKGWYQPRPWEEKLYQRLGVKSWKGRMPTYEPELFDPNRHSWQEIIGAMCQSELVHETNMVISFFPLVASVWFGAFWVFFITSVLGAGYDLMFVMMQRYNRPRVVRQMKRQQRKARKKT